MAWLGWLFFGVAVGVFAFYYPRYRSLQGTISRQARDIEQPAVLSHEIRTPLSLVRGAAELLIEESPGPLNPTQHMFVATIADNTQVVIDMAEDFLLQSRMQSGTFTVTASPVDVRRIVADTAREVRRILGTSIAVDAVGGVLPITSDERMIRQMLWNLINNAARHAGDDGAITVAVRSTSSGGCLVSVSDAGGGLTLEDIANLFTPFVTGSSRRPGSGLGMMIVKRIAETLGGRVFVDSEPGAGTAVVIELPRVAPIPGERTA